MTIAYPASDFRADQSRWATALALLGGAWAALLVLFHRDVADLAFIYWNSTTFGHCLFVPPVLAWLVWQRVGEVRQLVPQGCWPGFAIVAAGAGGWWLGELAGVAFARHLGLVLMLQGTVMAVLGVQVARALLFPLAWMIFLVPFGEWLEGPLQAATVAMVVPLLHLFGVPVAVDGVLLTIPNGYFEVAEACSGAKFVIAMMAYGTLVANVCFVSWRRRAVFLGVALVVPVIANGLRAFGTVYGAHLTSVEAATGFDHIVYGWLFFAGVMAAVLAIGWRWFDRDPDAAWVDVAALRQPVRGTIDSWTASGGVIGIATIAFAAGTLMVARADALPSQLYLPAVPGWTRVDTSRTAPWAPYYPDADHQLFGRYADPTGAPVNLAVAVYAGQREGHELVAFGQGVLRENDRWVKVSDEAPLAGGRTERITAPGPVVRTVATWYRLAGVTTSSGQRVKIETLKAKVLGGQQRAVAVHLSAEGPRARDAIAAFLAASGGPERIAAHVAGAR